jgi:hypothetical protein
LLYRERPFAELHRRLVSDETQTIYKSILKVAGMPASLSTNEHPDSAFVSSKQHERNQLSQKIKAKTIKRIAAVSAAIMIVFCVLAWIYAIGTPAASEDVAVTTEFQYTEYQYSGEAHLNKEWVIHFKLTNGKALNAKTDPVMKESEDGTRRVDGCIITLYEVQPSSLVMESDSFTYGYSQIREETSSLFRILPLLFAIKISILFIR